MLLPLPFPFSSLDKDEEVKSDKGEVEHEQQTDISRDEEQDEEKEDASYLTLIYEAASDECLLFLADLQAQLTAQEGRTYKPGTAYKKALGAFICALLRIETRSPKAYGFHRMNPEGFRLLRVGYKPFRRIVESMGALGYLFTAKGHKEHSGPRAKGVATRFKATPKLIALAVTHGIKPADWRRHFHRMPRPAVIPDPIVMKTASKYTKKGRRMEVDRADPIVIALAKPINDLNAFFASVVMEPDAHYAFQRVFANGNTTGKAWNQGGRIYSVGGAYQNMEQEKRAAIKLNGEATVELDIKGSFITILHARLKHPLPNRVDPYDIIGFDRGAVKTFVSMTLGYDKFHKDWTEDAKAGYAKKRKKKELPPLELPPFETVKEATLKAIPLLNRWPGSFIRWGDLQYIESEVILATVHTLAMVHSVPALPVHDSIIVPVTHRALAERLLVAQFYKKVGLQPIIEAKT